MSVQVSKVAWPEMKIDYGWMFDIRTLPELLDYIDVVRASKIQKDVTDALKWRRGEAHASILATMAGMLDCSIIDAAIKLNGDAIEGLKKCLRETDRIFISDSGAYFGIFNGIEISESKIVDEFRLPGVEPRIIRWPNGKHFYAKIGDVDILDSNKNQKWDTRAEAERAVDQYMKRSAR